MRHACRCRFHKPCAIHRGWSGLVRRALSFFVIDFSWQYKHVTVGTPLFYVHASKRDWMGRRGGPLLEIGWLPTNWSYLGTEGASRFRHQLIHHFKEK